ncbi:MAG: quinone-dependent dihydroorotate dehydrogenase [bacterium]|nr:quinone-dependent dihydroorotate dehydrogenase [bacterium]
MYKEVISPILDRFDSETAHVATREMLHFLQSNPATLLALERFIHRGPRFTDDRLNVSIGGVILDNPVMVGAGWDKTGSAIQALHAMGFSGIEVGSVLELPQEGNPKPRQFVHPSGVALNRLGFNSPGMHEVAANLQRYTNMGIPIGISLGKNKDVSVGQAPEAHSRVATLLHPFASYFTINVSSPNTPGLRQLQDKGPLTDIVQAVQAANKEAAEKNDSTIRPVFIKIAPDLELTAVDDVIDVVLENGLAGIVATNTTTNHPLKSLYGWGEETGGLSGNDPDFRKMSTGIVRHIFSQTKDQGIDIIGVGGVMDTDTTLEKLKAGARAVQIVTGIRSEGPMVASNIVTGLAQFLNQNGISDISQVVGADHGNLAAV